MKTKKSLLTDGDYGNPWYFSGDSSGEQFFINGIEYFVEPNPYEQDGYTVFPVTQVLEGGEWETICAIREGMSVEEIESLVLENTIRESTRKTKVKSMKKGEKEIPIKNDDVVEIEEKDGKKVVEVESKEDHKKEVESGDEKESDNLNAGKKKSVKKSQVKKGIDDIEWMIERCDGTETDVDVYLGQVEDVYDELISEIESDVESECGGVIITDEVRTIGPEVEELKYTIYKCISNLKSKLEDLRSKTASARKSINNTNIGRDSMRNMKKSALIKELEDIDEECEGKDCEDKKEETFRRSARRATRKDEEPDSKRMLQDDEISEDELREKCARARKRHLARTSRKGMRKADSAEPAGTIVDEVEDPEQVVSGNKESETPKETIVDEVEDPEELDSETHGTEQEGSVVDEVVDPEQLDKIRRAKIRRALAKRRMQKARQEVSPKYKRASVRKSPRQVRKFSVATRGSERYDGRQNYNQSPMMRQAIDNAFPKEDETVKSLNARLDEIRANSRNKVTNPIGKKRIH